MKRFTAVLLCVMTALCLSACDSGKEKLTIYFGSSDNRSLAEERIEILEDLGIEERANFALAELLGGPKDPEHKRVIPEGTNLISLKLKDKTATVNFSQEFEKSGDNSARLLSLYSVVSTLCEIEGISRVQMLVNGRNIKYASTGEDIGLLSMNNVITNDEIRRNQTAVAELYFGSKDKTGLIKQQRMIDIKDNETIEKTLVNELLGGPEEGAARLIPQDVKLLSVETKDNLCYLNLSKEFLGISDGDAYLAVYSIVNTLTGQWKTSGVQFLIEGEKTERIGGVLLSEPLVFNEAVIKSEDK